MLDEAVRLNPIFARAYRERGAAYAGLGQYQRAIQDYDEAIRLDPQDVFTYFKRVFAHAFLGMDAEAQEDIDRAVELGFDRALLEEWVEDAKQRRQP